MAICAACGLAIRKPDRIGISGFFVIHRSCETIPSEVWSARRVIRSEIEGEHGSDRRRIAELVDRNGNLLEALDQMSRTASAGWKRTEDELAIKKSQLQTLRTEFEALRNRAVSPAAASRRGTDLERMAFGLAVGRGIWGFAAYMMRLAMDTKDDAEARYALLELR
jgi:hypothetical protein